MNPVTPFSWSQQKTGASTPSLCSYLMTLHHVCLLVSSHHLRNPPGFRGDSGESQTTVIAPRLGTVRVPSLSLQKTATSRGNCVAGSGLLRGSCKTHAFTGHTYR